jgi:ubiquinone/menaquinone biosynthesis C-methylase UbiE
MRLNLGCSDRLEPGWLNVDLYPPADVIADLSVPWPWEDNSVDAIQAYDIFEHLPDKIFTLNEAYRVLKPEGQLDFIVPTTDGRGAFQDPTHKSYWTPNSLFYLEYGNPHNTRFKESYGMKHAFQILLQEHIEFPDKVWKLRAVLKPAK